MQLFSPTSPTRSARLALPTLLCALAALTAALATGCQRPADSDSPAVRETFGYAKEFRRGPARFTVRVDRTDISVAERLELALEVRCAEEYRVTLPEFGDKLARFDIAAYTAPPPRLTPEGEMLYRRSYTLEPFLAGPYAIPALEVRCGPAAPAGDGAPAEYTVSSEEIAVTVRSLLPDGKDFTLREIAGPVEMAGASSVRRLVWLLGGMLLAIAAAVGLLLRRRRGGGEIAPPVPPHEVAFGRLEALLAAGLVEAGRTKQFYLGLSTILRQYIEDRFGLRAPERTTEEFLVDLQTTELLLPDHKLLLSDFLRHCDLVKFAALRPGHDESHRTFEAGKRFIAETAPRPPAPAPAPTENSPGPTTGQGRG